MDILKPLSTQNPQIFSGLSLPSTSNSIKFYRNKNPPNFRRPSFKFRFSTSPPLSNSPLHSSTSLRVSALLDRPTKRRKNHLRKKLIEQQVRQNPSVKHDLGSTLENPVLKVDDTNDSLSNLGNSNDDVGYSVSIPDKGKVFDNTDALKSNNVLLNKLESWASQYKADAEFWGIGSNPIFTILQDSDGKVEKVDVNEDEILRRNQIDPSIYNLKEEEEHLKEVQEKIFHAKFLAKEMKLGKSVLPPNSSVVKIVNSDGKSGFRHIIHTITSKPGFVPKISKVGISVFCGIFVFLALKSFFRKENEDKEEYTSLEKEMLRRKIKARAAKEKSEKGNVEVIQDSNMEVIQDSKELEMVFTERPRVDKEELMNTIVKVKSLDDNSKEFDDKIHEIRAMARHAREIEKTDNSGEDTESMNNPPNEKEVNHIDLTSFEKGNIGNSDASKLEITNNNGEAMARHAREIEKTDKNGEDNESINNPPNEKEANHIDLTSFEKGNIGNSDVSKLEITNNNGEAMARHAREIEKTDKNGEDNESINNPPNEKEANHIDLTSFEKGNIGNSDASKLEITNNNGEAMARHAREIEKTDKNGEDNESINNPPNEKEANHIDLTSFEKGNIGNSDVSKLEITNDNGSVDREKPVEKKSLKILSSVKEAREYLDKKKLDKKENVTNFKEVRAPKISNNGDVKDEKEEHVKVSDAKAGELGRLDREKWMEDNFHEFNPIIEKIRGGFKENYMVAREKVKEDVKIELKMLEDDENESEFEWMKDEKLKEIVFQVRENELMGREPFYLMDSEDKALFFKGLEKKVEKVNETLSNLHEYVHSNIENLDYGADGISLYDPPEKIIPRWKGPPPSTTISQEFLDDYIDQRKALFAETLGNSDLVKRDPQNSLQTENPEKGFVKSSKTVIEGSDGSIKPGKKSGKEFWQHTKKWSRGFIDSYNSENDPETKAAMKDIGKDLDRWITEKEIQDVADVMDKVPEKGKRFISEKINKLKREMEVFGPQAVVSKYSEYGEEDEKDYYWWLDLPFLLCIELYIAGDGDERIGFYSLEMAEDLELDPKPHHIIAFEDAGDCKNLCYIIQAHMEMLGNGNAFVVPQLPKDTYQEAKANGFNVTVIRKGELKLDVDQTLEEVEEKIVEIGSKMYHDKIMKGRNVNVDSVMKGVFGMKKPTKRRRSKKKLKKPTK